MSCTCQIPDIPVHAVHTCAHINVCVCVYINMLIDDLCFSADWCLWYLWHMHTQLRSNNSPTLPPDDCVVIMKNWMLVVGWWVGTVRALVMLLWWFQVFPAGEVCWPGSHASSILMRVGSGFRSSKVIRTVQVLWGINDPLHPAAA